MGVLLLTFTTLKIRTVCTSLSPQKSNSGTVGDLAEGKFSLTGLRGGFFWLVVFLFCFSFNSLKNPKHEQ